MTRGADDLPEVPAGWENIARMSEIARASLPNLDALRLPILNINELFPEIAAASKLAQQWNHAFPREVLSKIPRIEIPQIEIPKIDIPKIDASHLFPGLEALRAANTQFLQSISRVRDQFQLFQPALDLYFKAEKRCSRLEEAGWLPHHTTPWGLLEDENIDPHSLNEAVEAHYRENWLSVRALFEDEIATYLIDDEAKATFSEALTAHEIGLFRCVARTLFPEIERVSRVEIHKGVMDKIAGQPKLKEAISELYPDELARDGIAGMRLYGKLMDHLYANLTTPEAVDTIAADPVPNRHAAVHGFVSYNSHRQSVNALIVGEYLLHAISVIVSAECEEVPAASDAADASA